MSDDKRDIVLMVIQIMSIMNGIFSFWIISMYFISLVKKNLLLLHAKNKGDADQHFCYLLHLYCICNFSIYHKFSLSIVSVAEA